MNRRIAFLPAAIALLLAGCDGPDLDGTGLVEITEHVYAFVAPGPSTGEGLGANSGFVVGSDGVLVVDARQTPALGRELLEAVRSVTDAPVRYLVYTHYHPDHTWGASVFEGALVLACPGTGSLLEFYSPRYLEHYRRNAPRVFDLVSGVKVVPPDSTVKDGDAIDLGGVEVVLGCVGPAHTAGDCLVTVPEERVLFSGGLAANGYHLNLGDPGVNPEHWLEVLAGIDRGKYRYIVPGQGKVCGPEALDGAAGYIRDLLDICRGTIREGVPLERAVDEISIPGTADFEQANILPFNIQACYRRYVVDVVGPPFEIDPGEGFTVGDGGGSAKSGRVLWTGGGGRMEIEARWEPTARTEIITQDIRDYMEQYLRGRPALRMDVEGSRSMTIGGERALALHGAYREGPERVAVTTGFYTWVMMVRGGAVYSFRLRAGDGESAEVNRANLDTLESLLATVRFR